MCEYRQNEKKKLHSLPNNKDILMNDDAERHERRFTNKLLFKHRQQHTCIYYNAIVNTTI